jgi:hypothetical protein
MKGVTLMSMFENSFVKFTDIVACFDKFQDLEVNIEYKVPLAEREKALTEGKYVPKQLTFSYKGGVPAALLPLVFIDDSEKGKIKAFIDLTGDKPLYKWVKVKGSAENNATSWIKQTLDLYFSIDSKLEDFVAAIEPLQLKRPLEIDAIIRSDKAFLADFAASDDASDYLKRCKLNCFNWLSLAAREYLDILLKANDDKAVYVHDYHLMDNMGGDKKEIKTPSETELAYFEEIKKTCAKAKIYLNPKTLRYSHYQSSRENDACVKEVIVETNFKFNIRVAFDNIDSHLIYY